MKKYQKKNHDEELFLIVDMLGNHMTWLYHYKFLGWQNPSSLGVSSFNSVLLFFFYFYYLLLDAFFSRSPDVIVFDLDGTLIDSNRVWDKTFPTLFDEIGVTYVYTEEDHYNPAGIRTLLAANIRRSNITPDKLCASSL